MAFVAALSLVSVTVGTLSSRPALAGVTDPTTTTEPAPDPTTTTEPAPDPTTTTEPAPDPTTTTEPAPDPTTTTGPAPDPTSTSPTSPTDPAGPADPEAQAGKLEPAEALVPLPEFGALSGHQRALVQALQTATDVYALRRFALVDLLQQVAAAKGALATARAAENVALRREIVGLAAATHADEGTVDAEDGAAPRHWVAAVNALARHLDAERKDAQRARVQAQAAVASASARLAAAIKAVADATADRSSAESAIEHELGSDAVRARPDGITATLLAAQAGQPDPIVIAGMGQPIPGAALSSPFGLRNDPLSGGAGFHPGVDLTAVSGTPIHAAAAGLVVMAGDCGGYGYCVVIDHGESVATLYAHQSQVLVQVGEHVDAAQVIGLVGATGLATGPHLHFELRLHGLPIDPVLAFPAG